MAPRGAISQIAYTVDSASEDEFQIPTPDSAVENRAPSRKVKSAPTKPIAKPATTKITKAKPAARRASGGSVLGVKKEKAAVAKKAPAKRKALAEREEPNASGTEEVDEFADEEMEEEPIEEKRSTRRGRPKKAVEDESVTEVPQAKAKKTASKTAEPRKAAPKTKAASKASKAVKEEPPMTIPETQPEPEPMDMDLEESIEQSIELDEVPEAMAPPPKPKGRQPAQPRAIVKHNSSSVHRRAGSVSDTERGTSDPMLRRNLGEARKKLENMTLKYENIKETAQSDKESNFERLKRTTDQRAKDQADVIASLKAHITSLQAKSSDLSSLKKDNARLTEANTSLSSENKTLSSQLTSAQNETKTLSTKLAAARSSQPPESKNVPGSAVKQRSVVLPGSAEAAKETQMRQLKEELYSDLTGLIVRGVKRGEEGDDLYDCIQTGRNGTLHFHLSVALSDAYEDAEFAYTPLLDENRDKDLLDILPDYLTEEICFPRSHAAKFYAKVVDCMTKRVVVEE